MPRASRSDIFWRAFAIVADSVGSGLLLGGLLGSAVPVAGSLVGGIIGAVAGLVASPVLVSVLLRRNLGRAFRSLLIPSGVVAGVFGLLGFLVLLGGPRDFFWPLMGFGVVMTGLVFFGEVSRVARRQPIVWPPAEGGMCESCGYPLTGLTGDRCPECGADVTIR